MEAAYKVLRVPPDSVRPDSLAFSSLRSQTQGASLSSFAPGPQSPLGGSDVKLR